MAAMEWGMRNCGNNIVNDGEEEEEVVGGGEGVGFVQVMTDEQTEELRRQIAAYAAICEQLVEMHKAVTAQQDAIAGMRLGGIYPDSLMTPTGPKISGRQRWTPTSMQLQILENMFEQGIGTPSKQKIKEITHELSQHGHISESNVYNWFQNRRARSKRKQTPAQLNSSEPDTDADADDESTTEKKLRAEIHPHENQHMMMDNHQLQGFPVNHELQYLNSEHDLQYLPEVQERVKMDMSGNYMGYQSGESYDMMS